MKEIVLFGVDGCNDCALQKKSLSKTRYDYKFISIDTEDLEEMILMNQIEVDDIPTLAILNGGQCVFKHCGVLASRKIIEAMEG